MKLVTNVFYIYWKEIRNCGDQQILETKIDGRERIKTRRSNLRLIVLENHTRHGENNY